MSATAQQLRVDRPTPQRWRVTFDHPPLNLIDPGTIRELDQLVTTLETDPDVRVVVFDSADPDYFLAHYDVVRDSAETISMPNGRTGMHPWLDLTTRLSRAPVVSIAAIRGRARGAGSEFVLACDLRFASRERAILAQPEVSLAFVPGGGPMARLPQLVGRGRALEILLGGQDVDGELAERYGYVKPRPSRRRARRFCRCPRRSHRLLRQASHRRDQALRRSGQSARRRVAPPGSGGLLGIRQPQCGTDADRCPVGARLPKAK